MKQNFSQKSKEKVENDKNLHFFGWFWGLFQRVTTPSGENLETFCKSQELSKWVNNGFEI